MTLFFIGFGLFRLLCFTFLILLLIKIVSIARVKVYRRHMEFSQRHMVFDAVNLAAQRYADGDISADQFKEIRLVLKE